MKKILNMKKAKQAKRSVIKVNIVADKLKVKKDFGEVLSSITAIPKGRTTHKLLQSQGYDIEVLDSFKRGSREFITKLKFLRVKPKEVKLEYSPERRGSRGVEILGRLKDGRFKVGQVYNLKDIKVN
jgi:hypothetical protein